MNMKLRKEVKSVLVIVLIVMILILLARSIVVDEDKAIEQCVSGGQSREICESGLLK